MCNLEIQDGSQISGSTNNFAAVLQTHVVPKTIQVFMTVRNTQMCSNYGLRYIVSKIEDGSQLTGRTNISETTTYIIKIPTANPRHSTMANSQEVYLGDSDNDLQSEVAAAITRDSFFRIGVVENPRFAVGTVILSVVVPEI